MKIGEFLNKLATNSGILAENPKLKIVLSSPTLTDQDIDDEVATTILSNLLTEEAAKANPKIKNAIMAETLNPIQSRIEALAEKHGIKDKWNAYRDENVKKTATGLNTYDLVEKFNEFLAAEVKASATGTMTADKVVLAKQIEELNAAILTTKNTYEGTIKELNDGRKADKVNWMLDSLYGGFNYAMEEANKMPKDACIIAAKAFVQNKLQQDGVKITQDDQGNIQLRTNTDSDVFIQNQKVGVKDYMESVLTGNNFLKISAKSDAGEGNRQGKLPVVDPTKHSNGQQSAVAKLDAMIADS